MYAFTCQCVNMTQLFLSRRSVPTEIPLSGVDNVTRLKETFV